MRHGRRSAIQSGSALGHDPVVLGVVDRLGLVDEHDRDVVLDPVAPVQARVVERVLVLEVEQRPLVLGAGEDLQQLRVEGHVGSVLLDQGGEFGDVGVDLGGRRAPRG